MAAASALPALLVASEAPVNRGDARRAASKDWLRRQDARVVASTLWVCKVREERGNRHQ